MKHYPGVEDDGWFERVNCIFCGDSETEVFDSGTYHLNLLPPLSIIRCKQCHLLYMSPRPSAIARSEMAGGKLPPSLRSYDHQSPNYVSVSLSRAELFKKRWQWFDTFMTRGSFVLDIGCSSGIFLEIGKKKGYRTFGIEVDIEGLRNSTRNHQRVVQAIAEEIPFSGATFHLVHAHHVFEHLADPLQAAKETFRVLRPGGFLFIEVPNQLGNVMFRRDRWFHRIPQRPRTIRSIHHLYFFTKKTIARLTREAGFEIVTITDRYSWPIPRNWRGVFSIATRIMGKFAGGGDRIQMLARRPK